MRNNTVVYIHFFMEDGYAEELEGFCRTEEAAIKKGEFLKCKLTKDCDLYYIDILQSSVGSANPLWLKHCVSKGWAKYLGKGDMG